MDTRTGNIISNEEAEKLFKENREMFEKHFIEVGEDEMTPKQKETRQVSQHDNKSKLGKKFTAARHQRNYHFKTNKGQ